MTNHIRFDSELIRKYDTPGPRYTSYPTAAEFHTAVGVNDYVHWARMSNEDPIPRPLSLYIHVPFCDTVCYYCACNKVVTKDHSKAIEYLRYLEKEMVRQAELYDDDRPVRQLHFGGGTPTFLNNGQLSRLMGQIRNHFRLLDDDKGDYSIEIDPRKVNHEVLDHLRDIGFNRISLGVQDFDPKVQAAVNRIQPEEQTIGVLNYAREFGFRSINMDLIYGLPFQTQESFTRTLEKVIVASPDRLSVFNYAHLPTRFMPQRRINTEDLPSAAEKLEILQTTVRLLIDAGYQYIGMDHFAKPDDELAIAQREGRLHRNFQGYTLCGDCDLVAMGPSAISDLGHGYAQNHVKLEDYYKALDEGDLAITKGVEVETDDEMRKEAIMGLMCNMTLDLPFWEKRWNCHFWAYFEEERKIFEPMIADGLVEITETAINVLPPGRFLIRPICQVFDRYRRTDSPIARFSRVI